MGYLGNYLGPDNGDGYLDDWFDADASAGPPSEGGGNSVARILGTIAPRPQVPPHRTIDSFAPAGMMLQEIRRFLNEMSERSNVWGNHVEVTFPGAGTSVRVDTGLGGPPEGYKIVRANGDLRVWDGTLPAGVDPTPERGIIWLQANAAGKVTLFIY